MNTSQITSLITLLITAVCGFFVSQGKMDGDTSTKLIAGVVALITWFIAHQIHGVATNATSDSGGSKTSLLLALILPALMFTGCASAPTAAYKVESAADITVTAAMTAWGEYVAQNHPPASQEIAVREAFEKYQSAELLAINSTAALLNVSPTNSIAQNLAAANKTSAQAALLELVNMLQGFGVKL